MEEQYFSNNGGKLRKINNNNNSGHHKQQQDRLSSLFHPLLVEILSQCLSRRWRHLWTQITTLHFSSGKQLSAVNHILPQLTSPLISALVIPFDDAALVERLTVDVSVKADQKEVRLWKEYEFCETLFTLPRSSSTSEIDFHGDYVHASSNAFSCGFLTCQLRCGVPKH